jgi:hypothetical protein
MPKFNMENTVNQAKGDTERDQILAEQKEKAETKKRVIREHAKAARLPQTQKEKDDWITARMIEIIRNRHNTDWEYFKTYKNIEHDILDQEPENYTFYMTKAGSKRLETMVSLNLASLLLIELLHPDTDDNNNESEAS